MDKNLKLLHILSNNARVSTKELAKQINTSQQNASYKISNLTSSKTIKSFVLLADSSKFGYNNFCVFLSIKKFSKTFLNTLSKELKNYNEITAIEFLFGTYDIFLRFTTTNTSNFNKVLKEILSKYSKEITNYLILTQIVIHHYSSDYLSRKKYDNKLIMSGDRKQKEIDSTDKKILNLLNENSRTNFSIIAAKLNSTPKTIISKVKHLEKTKIIKGYTIDFDRKKVGIKRYFLFLKFDYIDKEHDTKFTNYTQNNTNIIELVKLFGDWDTILILETASHEIFKENLYEIKEKFSENLSKYNYIESENIIQTKYIPYLE